MSSKKFELVWSFHNGIPLQRYAQKLRPEASESEIKSAERKLRENEAFLESLNLEDIDLRIKDLERTIEYTDLTIKRASAQESTLLLQKLLWKYKLELRQARVMASRKAAEKYDKKRF